MNRRPLFRTATLALVVAALSACTLPSVPPARPVEIPASQRFLPELAPDSRTLAGSGWRDYFQDPVLQKLISLALENNRDLRIAQASVDFAIGQLRLREAETTPLIGLGLGSSSAPQANGTLARSVNSSVQFSAWEIDFFGRLNSLSEAARAQWLATEEASRAARLSLVASVAATWLNLIADEELLALTEQTLETREESLRLTRLRFDNGAASELDFRQAQSLAEGARVVRAQQLRQRSLNRNALVQLMGMPDAATPELARTRLADIALSDVPVGVPSTILLSRPDIRQAEHSLIAAEANIDAARAAFLPRITLTGAFGSVSRDLTGLFAGGSWGFTVAPNLFQPLFSGGRDRATLQSAAAARDIALAQYERAIQAGFREIADGLAGRSTLIEQLRAQSGVADAERARMELAKLRYENGIASYLDLLDAQRSLFAANQAVIQTRLLLMQNQVSLFRSLGGGWREHGAAPASGSPAARPPG